MAIAKMKRLSLVALKADKEKLMIAMQRMGCVEVTDVPEDVRELKAEGERNGALLSGELTRLQWAIDRMKKYDTAGKIMFGCVPEITQTEADKIEADKFRYLDIVSALEADEQRLGLLRGDEARALAGLSQLEPWRSFDATPRALHESRATRSFTGSVPEKTFAEAQNALAGQPAVLDTVQRTAENAFICVIAHISCADEIEKKLTAAGFAPELFSQLEEDETPAMGIARMRKELTDIEAERARIEESTKRRAESLPQLKVLHDEIAVQVERLKTERLAAETESAFLITGWVPDHLAEKVTARLQKLAPTCSVDLSDPKEDEEPPVLLQNSRVATPFESVVEGFTLPAYRSYDPTAIMAPFYACLFGMMVSDAGYGLLMAIAIPIFIKVKKIKFENAKMMYLLTYGGIATVIWGLIYNTVFGFNPLPKSLWLLDPVTNSLPVMGICLAIGALHLFTGLGVAAYMNFKRGDPIAAISDQFSWVLLLCGLGMLLLPATAEIGKILAIVGLAIILLMTGRGNKNPIKRLMKGLSSLYGITSWISDLLSYMRLFGMGLATGVIGMVFNQLIGMVWGGGLLAKPFAIVLFIGCHLFNLAINVLGAYVHSCRLQYIEFFGKFYEEGGRPFKPLNTKTKYVSIKQDAA